MDLDTKFTLQNLVMLKGRMDVVKFNDILEVETDKSRFNLGARLRRLQDIGYIDSNKFDGYTVYPGGMLASDLQARTCDEIQLEMDQLRAQISENEKFGENTDNLRRRFNKVYKELEGAGRSGEPKFNQPKADIQINEDGTFNLSLTGGMHGPHRIENSDRERVLKHAKGYCDNNKKNEYYTAPLMAEVEHEIGILELKAMF